MPHVVHVIANNSSVPYLNWFADRLTKYKGVKFTFIALCAERPIMIEEMKTRGCECIWVKFDHKRRKTGMIKSLFRLCFLFLKLKPDVVNTHLFDDSFITLIAARLAGIKKRILRKQDTAFHWMYTPHWVWADRVNNRNATSIVAVSEEARKFIIDKEGAPESKIVMIHNGIPIEEFTKQNKTTMSAFRTKYGLKDKIVIGTIARFIEWKGYRYIIEAVRVLVETNKDLRFLFVGEGEQKEEMIKLVTDYNLGEYILFTGWIAREDIPSLFGILDVYLHAAVMEPFGFVISEAMANGVPIVTTKTGAAADVLNHKETCYFLNDKDSASIVDGINWMLYNNDDKDNVREKLKKIALASFSIDTMVDKHMKLYLE